MSCIIAATDGSDPARLAADFAAALALRLGERLLLVTVIRPDTPVYQPAPAPDPSRPSPRELGAARLLFDEVRRLRRNGVEVTSAVRIGRAVSELAALALQREVSMVVVGSRGQGATSPSLTGSVSSALARICSKPVIVVPCTTTPEMRTSLLG